MSPETCDPLRTFLKKSKIRRAILLLSKICATLPLFFVDFPFRAISELFEFAFKT